MNGFFPDVPSVGRSLFLSLVFNRDISHQLWLSSPVTVRIAERLKTYRLKHQKETQYVEYQCSVVGNDGGDGTTAHEVIVSCHGGRQQVYRCHLTSVLASASSESPTSELQLSYESFWAELSSCLSGEMISRAA